MKWAFIAAIVNAGIFLLWMVGFANPLPSVFLIVPFLIIVTHWLTRGRPRNEELWGGIPAASLILNFIVFCGALLRSGGGM